MGVHQKAKMACECKAWTKRLGLAGQFAAILSPKKVVHSSLDPPDFSGQII
jgi:hypothetical protein